MNHLPTVCVLVAARCQNQWEGPQVNKFEQVSSDDHQMSLAGTGLGWGDPMSGGGPRARAGGGVHCTKRTNASWVMAT